MCVYMCVVCVCTCVSVHVCMCECTCVHTFTMLSVVPAAKQFPSGWNATEFTNL